MAVKSKRKGRHPGTIPLRYRLPNPPPLFVGRCQEVDALVEAIRRAPVAVVWGLGGLGKTALVLHTLHRYFARRVPRTLIINLSPGDHAEDICTGSIRAIAEVEGHSGINWPDLMADPETLAATAIDLAEMGGWWLVLDNLHHAEPGPVADVLMKLANYARKSRWIAVSRVEPPLVQLTSQVLYLAGMQEQDLRELIGQSQPQTPANQADTAIGASGGSPWQLQQLLRGQGMEAHANDLLAGLSQTTVDFLRTLSVLERPFEAKVLASVAEAPAEQDLRTLQQQAILERTDAGWRLHDVARPLVEAALTPQARQTLEQRCGQALAEQDESVALLESLRLLRPDIARAVALLDTHGECLLANGWAPELWRLLEQATDERLSSWRLRVAVELGEPGSLAQVEPPEAPSIADRWMWTRALFGRGKLEEAAEVATQVMSDAGSEHSVTFECGLLRARALGDLGQPLQALEELARLAPSSDQATARRDIAAAVCLVDLGEQQAAMEAIAKVRPRLEQLDGRARLEVGYGIVGAYYKLGKLSEASQALEALIASVGERALFLERGRMLLLLRAGIAADQGRLDEARAVYARLEPLAASTGLRFYVRGAVAMCRFAMGDLGGLDQEIADLVAQTKQLGEEHDIACSIATLLLRLRMARAEPAEVLPEPKMCEPERSFFQRLAGLVGTEYGIRQGTRDEAVAVEAFAENAELQVWAEVCNALLAATRGQHASAASHISRGIEIARDSGYGVLEAEATNVRCEILMAAAGREEAARAAGELGGMAEKLPSTRLAHAARLFDAMARADYPDPARLEQLAAAFDIAPTTARRAQALLGSTPALDALDRLVLASVASRVSIVPVGDPQAEGAWVEGWGLDEPRSTVWLPAGRTVSFSGDALPWRILTTIADHEGNVSKEDLVLEAWDEPEYHPLKHDNRLRLAIRKLRQAIEDDASNPTRLLTTSDGYAFGGHVRRLRRLAS
ncbi:hypothetical protein ACFL6C_00355 [Myxococcota bacterium]